MKLFLKDPPIGPEDGFTKDDIFGYADFGKSLGNLLAAVEDPLVMALDGPWGSGKSIFTKMWAGYLKGEGFPVIYFDAFANDYMDDAFLALAGEVVELAEDRKATSKKAVLTKAKNVGRTLLKHGTNIGVKIATVNALDAEDAKTIASDVGKAASDLTDQALDEILTGRKKDKDALADFSSALAALVGDLQPGVPEDDRKPLIFIIDELDRCRPNFALDILERIKHVFSTHNVHFVLVTHLEQLANAVKVRYGADIDAETYLQKFCQIAVSLPGGDEVQKDKAPGEHLARVLRSNEFTDSKIEGIADVFKRLEVLAIELKLPFRTISRIYSQLVFGFLSPYELREARINLMLGLAVLRVRRMDLYERAKRGMLTIEDMDAVFGFSGWQPTHSKTAQEIRLHWRYALDRDHDAFSEAERGLAMVAFRQSGFKDQYEAPRMVALSMEKLRLS